MSDKDNYEKSIKDRLKQKRQELGVNSNILLRKFLIDGFLLSLSESNYSSSFVWKGGFVLSAITGIDKRTTVDIDTVVDGISLDRETLSKIVKDIIQSNPNNNITYTLVSIEPIQEEKDYSGLRIKIKASLSNLNDTFHIDIATGEKLKLSAVKYSYRPILEKQPINIMIYPPERILAEKLQTLLTRGLANTRMKDFYDIYILYKSKRLNILLFSQQFESVMKERETSSAWNERNTLLDNMLKDNSMKRKWQGYVRMHTFANNVTFEETVNSASKLLTEIEDSISL